ncbi:MAG TPA: hypothetical protein VD866_13480 [Urbifossiella sp.]|nr:hypothetical protein [Urbifossiella sp.]
MRRLLGSLHGTVPFREYCASRGIPLRGRTTSPLRVNLRSWSAALAALPGERRAAVELELTEVAEMAGPDATAHLIAAAGPDHPPPPDVPAGAPLALWFLLHQADLFHEVFLHHEAWEARFCRTARAPPGLRPDDLPRRAAALARELGAVFGAGTPAGRFCAVDACRLDGAYSFTARVADRPRHVEGFTGDGRLTVRRLRPALTVLLAYDPRDGTVFLTAPLRAAGDAPALFRCFGRAVLGRPVAAAGDAFDLDRLKLPFRPLPDADDMELVRVKALLLRYPARLARRQVKLETAASDSPTAIEELLDRHVRAGDVPLDDLRVAYAELQVRLRTRRGGRTHLVRLWPDRCDLDHAPLGRRLRACLYRWGLARG